MNWKHIFTSNALRWALTACLLFCVWLGRPWWTLPLAVTLSCIANEIQVLIRQIEKAKMAKMMTECVPGELMQRSISEILTEEIRTGQGNHLVAALQSRA